MMGILFLVIFSAGAGATVFFLVKSNDNGIRNSAFLAKYERLIFLLTEKRKAEIEKVRLSSVSIRINMNHDNHFFILTEVDDRLIIVWKLHSRLFGKRGKEWSFNPAYSQNKMYEEVLTDIRNYHETLRSEDPGQLSPA